MLVLLLLLLPLLLLFYVGKREDLEWLYIGNKMLFISDILTVGE